MKRRWTQVNLTVILVWPGLHHELTRDRRRRDTLDHCPHRRLGAKLVQPLGNCSAPLMEMLDNEYGI